MRKFQIWSEGNLIANPPTKHKYHGEITAETFEEACWNFFMDDKEYNLINGFPSYGICRLYDNEEDARKATE